MKCPQCGAVEHHMTDKATTETIDWRRHKCDACGFHWTTSECEDDPLVPFFRLKKPEYSQTIRA